MLSSYCNTRKLAQNSVISYLSESTYFLKFLNNCFVRIATNYCHFDSRMARLLIKKYVSEVFPAERECQFLPMARSMSILFLSSQCKAHSTIDENCYLPKVRWASDRKWQKACVFHFYFHMHSGSWVITKLFSWQLIKGVYFRQTCVKKHISKQQNTILPTSDIYGRVYKN